MAAKTVNCDGRTGAENDIHPSIHERLTGGPSIPPYLTFGALQSRLFEAMSFAKGGFQTAAVERSAFSISLFKEALSALRRCTDPDAVLVARWPPILSSAVARRRALSADLRLRT